MRQSISVQGLSRNFFILFFSFSAVCGFLLIELGMNELLDFTFYALRLWIDTHLCYQYYRILQRATDSIMDDNGG